MDFFLITFREHSRLFIGNKEDLTDSLIHCRFVSVKKIVRLSYKRKQPKFNGS